MEYLIRFVADGLVVSVFAALGGALRPKSFVGLFGASPSFALATLCWLAAALASSNWSKETGLSEPPHIFQECSFV